MRTEIRPSPHRMIVDDFCPLSKDLRSYFDKRLAETLTVNPPPKDRFVWDYWHVPKEYTYFRTPAADFFEKPLLTAFYRHLMSWGLETLGTLSTDGLWLSYYLHGCRQEIHHDKGNGEWAFVYSLTNWDQRTFQGSETFLADPELRPYRTWPELQNQASRSRFEMIEPRFGRLVVFDSRVPHGVRPIEGTFNPLEGRIVIHGWLKASGVHITGGLPRAQVAAAIEAATEALEDVIADFHGVEGLLTARLSVAEDG